MGTLGGLEALGFDCAVLAVFGAVLLAGVAGVVLFAAGLVMRRPGIWGPGLGVSLPALCLLLAVFIFGTRTGEDFNGPVAVGSRGGGGRGSVVRYQQARTTTAAADIASIGAALAAFDIDNGRYPTTEEGLQALVTAPAGLGNWHGPYLRSLPADPWGNAYVYRSAGWHNGPDRFDLHSLGPDGRDGGGDDIDNWSRR